MTDFWKDTWELRKRIFGYPTIADLVDAYRDGTLPSVDIYSARYEKGNPNIPTVWITNMDVKAYSTMYTLTEQQTWKLMWGGPNAR
jgi:hypothetical protein